MQNINTPQSIITSEQVTSALIAAYAMEQCGQEVEYIHKLNLAKAKIRQLMKELDMQEVDLSIHEMD